MKELDYRGKYKIVDCHVHLFGPHYEKGADDLEGSRHKPLFPAFTVHQLIEHMNWAGIDVAMTLPPIWIGGKFIDPNYERANEVIAEAAKKFPERIVGFGRVNPNYGDRSVAEFKRCLTELGLKGLKLNPEWDTIPVDSTLIHPLMEVAAKYRVPVAIHSGPNRLTQPSRFLPLAQSFPDVTIVMLHMGRTHVHVPEACMVAKQAPNVYMGTTGQLGQYIMRAIKRVGHERIVYGSDFPYSVPQARIIDIAYLPDLSDEAKSAILGGNLAKILKLSFSH